MYRGEVRRRNYVICSAPLCRSFGINRHMSELTRKPPIIRSKGGKKMEFLIPLGILLIWIVLQVWVLPRFGVKT
jgi:hypothetical protein